MPGGCLDSPNEIYKIEEEDPKSINLQTRFKEETSIKIFRVIYRVWWGAKEGGLRAEVSFALFSPFPLPGSLCEKHALKMKGVNIYKLI